MLFSTEPFYLIPEGVETRWASPENPDTAKGVSGKENAGRKGAAWFPLKPGEERVLAHASGTSGMIRRIWVTINERVPLMLRGLRLDIFWDGAGRPAVSVPLGDFFGTGLGRTARFESAAFASPEGRSFCCYLPMPFRSGMRITVTNETDTQLGYFFYDVNFTVGDRHHDETLFFHAHWCRENPTTMQRDYEFLPRVEGRGRFLGVNMGVAADRERYFTSWWGEGEVKFYLDGDTTHPTLCGTGTEDYIGTGWGQGRYDNLFTGCHVADHEQMKYCFYRYHIPDPVYFRKEIRATIQQIGCWSPGTTPLLHRKGDPVHAAGPGRKELDFSGKESFEPYGLFEREDDWSSCAYFYLDRPENELPPLSPLEDRLCE